MKKFKGFRNLDYLLDSGILDTLELDLLISALRRYKVDIYNSPSCCYADYDKVLSLLRKLECFNK